LRDTEKFLELLEPAYSDAVKYCRALCSNLSADDAEDVLQQALLKALESLESLNDRDKFRSWFFKIITRVFYTHLRRHFWRRFLPMDTHPGIGEMPEVYDRIERNEDASTLMKALSKLSARERSAVLLYEIAGFSIEEIASVQNDNSLSAVKSRLSRARRKLRKHISAIEQTVNPDIKNSSNNIMELNNRYEGDLENETIKLIAQIKAEK
jgi:RNA polymerase sigma-70 factor (ECF subfamily)